MAVETSSLFPESLRMFVESQDHSSIVSMNLFVALLCACIIIGHLLEGNRWMNESITALVIGLCSGVLILLTTGGKSSHLLSFSEDLFFNYLLPPIIFNAGFKVKKKQFFRNFTTIMLFGVVGTLISFSIISFGAMHFFQKMNVGPLKVGDYLAIGAIFSATDSVCTLQVLNQDDTPLLYSLVFGEGVVNDATSLVLFNAIQSFDLTHINSVVALELVGNFLYLFVASTLLGVLAGLLSAYTIKKLYCSSEKSSSGVSNPNLSPNSLKTRHSTDREVALMILMAYLSYMLAELFCLSAIITVYFCGIVMSHYGWYNLSGKSRITTKHTVATLSFVAEIFIFLYVGMDALDIEKWRIVSDSPGTPIGVSSVLLALVLVGRAAFVFPLSFLSNLTQNSPLEKVNLKQQVTIWWAGLMRGAVSMALTYNQFSSSSQSHLHRNAIMITSTISVVLFSTVVFGSITKPLVRLLLPSSKHINVLSSEPSSPKYLTAALLGDGQADPEANTVHQTIPRPTSLRMILNIPSHTVHHYWRKFDDGFMRPIFGGRGFVPLIPDSPTE